MNIYSLIVQQTEKCIKVLKYIDKCISTINRTGIKILIESLPDNCDNDILEICHKNGINRLPALIDNDGLVFIGYKQIISRLKKIENNKRLTDVVNRDEVSDFWKNELFEGTSKDGKPIFKTDSDTADVDDASGDIDKKLSQYRSNAPKHHNNKPTSEPKQSNVVADRKPTTDTTISIDGLDDTDTKMLNAWLDNNM